MGFRLDYTLPRIKMSSSESESSEISAEPTGAITGRREVTRIMQMDPFYEEPEGKLVDVSEPDQRVPDVRWGTSDAWSTSRRTATEEMHEAFATIRASERIIKPIGAYGGDGLKN